MKKLFYALGVLSFCFLPSIVINAQTGSKDTTISFMGVSRPVSYYVPTDYSDDVPAGLMISLHGSGDNANNMRNAMVNRFTSILPNTIIICPDGGHNNPSKDFFNPEGYEEIIQRIIDIAKEKWNIDASEIILQGFSLGGRSALRYGLKYPEKFKALILNTPAAQGVKEAAISPSPLYNYENAPKILVYITCGYDDYYNLPVDSLKINLLSNGGIVHHRVFTTAELGGAAHNIPGPTQMAEGIKFINSYITDYELEIIKVITPLKSKESDLPVSVWVMNKGSEVITNIRFSYNVAGEDASIYLWTGTLNPLENRVIQLPDLHINNPGNYTLTVRIDTLNLTNIDNITYNNSAKVLGNIQPDSKILPYKETFPGVTSIGNWGYDNLRFLNDWGLTRAGDLPFIYDADLKCIYGYNTILSDVNPFDNSGRKNEIISPFMNLTTFENPSVAFDVAFKYMRYEGGYAQYGAQSDTLEVSISTDYGNTYTSLYKKWGNELLTYSEPFINLISQSGLTLTNLDNPNNWRRVIVDLSEYAECTDALIKFSHISGRGGFILLTDFTFSNESSITEQYDLGNIMVFQEQDDLTITTEGCTLKTINLYDITGRKIDVYNIQNAETIYQINLADVTSGLYLLEIITDNGTKTVKIPVSR